VWAQQLARLAAGLATVLVAALAVAILALSALPLVGGGLLVITSGSMSPAIATGDAVVLRDTPPSDIEPGDVIAYEGYGNDGLVTHRVLSRHDVDGRVHFRTQGDANAQPDADLAPAAGMVGEVGLVLPEAGWLLSMLTGRAAQLGLAGLALAVAAWQARDLLGRGGGSQRRATPPEGRRPGPPRKWTRPAPPRRSAHPGAATMVALVGLAGVACFSLLAVSPAGALYTGASSVADNSFATKDVVPPSNVTATFDCGTLGLGKGIRVEWDGVSGADSYEVARSTESGGPYTTIATVDASSTSYMDNDVNNDTTYYYVVRTVDGDWTSENSAQASETTPSSSDCVL
jgi:signal peptidase